MFDKAIFMVSSSGGKSTICWLQTSENGRFFVWGWAGRLVAAATRQQAAPFSFFKGAIGGNSRHWRRYKD